MKKTILFIFTIVSAQLYAQEITIQNGNVNACSGIFTDSGGEFANYSNNENFVFTLCPEAPEVQVRLNFQTFATQLGMDIMTIYDGNSVSSPILGSFSGLNMPGVITSDNINNSGCLTIEFVSSATGSTLGWAATISCVTPCQNITSQLDATVPAPNGDGIIEVCSGENISLQGSGIFEVDGSNATYTWDLGDGNTALGQNVNVSYDMPGVYLVDLHIRDNNTDNFGQGCPDSNTLNQVIRVSGEPDFTGTQADDDTLCFGDSTVIEAVVNPLTLIYNCPPPESEETFLPDGSGAVYSTCIDVTCFDPNAVLTDVSQLLDICLNMEHSYSGDLDIKIISPNGQEAILFDQAGGGTYFGGPNDNDESNPIPGNGADYCFSMSGSTLLVDAQVVQAGNPLNNSWQPGIYLPVGSFIDLVGSPLNGEWCIQIVDNLGIDNGYIFSWELNFDPSIPQEDFTFIPSLISQSWDSDPSITETNGNVITVAPGGSGVYCYTYRTVDVFGCEFNEVVCITVADESQPPITYYEDADGDGYGNPDVSIVECSPVPPFGYVLNNLDCNDASALFNPDMLDELGNGIDENCDGVDGNLLSIDDITAKIIKISPNPFNNHLVIDVPAIVMGGLLETNIYDLNGRIVHHKIHSNPEGVLTIINLDGLEKAPYFLEIANKEIGLKVYKKLIKL